MVLVAPGTILEKSIRNSIEFCGHKPTIIPVHKQKNSYNFTKEQLNDYKSIKALRLLKNFEPSAPVHNFSQNNGDLGTLYYEDPDVHHAGRVHFELVKILFHCNIFFH